MTLPLVICKLLHSTADMGACLSFEHTTQQLPELIRDIFWVIKSAKETLVRRNCVEKDFLCPKGMLVLSPVRCNDL
jgi:hypothetical protein